MNKNLKIGAISFLVVLVIIIIAFLAEEQSQSNRSTSLNPTQPQIAQLTKSNNHMNNNSIDASNTPGFYKTVDDTFYGVQPNELAKPDIQPNEDMLDQIRREKYHYREKISNRNAGQYIYPNKLGWWPRASYAAGLRLEPGQWPKYENPPFSIAWRSDEQACGPDNPATYGGPDNSGIPVNAWGRIIRRGMCVNGKADCPLGQTSVGARCVGEAARDAFGNLIWSRTEWASPITDIADIYTAEKLEGGEIGTSYH